MGLEITDEVQTEATDEGSSTGVTTNDDGSTTEVENQATNQVKAEAKAEANTEETTEGNPEESVKEPESSSNDFDYSKYEQEFLSTGDVSDESKAELYKVFPKNLVDNYIENMKQATAYAIAENEKKAFALVGGEDNYKELLGWASKNLDLDEKDAFNELVSGSNEKLALQAIKGLQARMELAKAASKRPNIIMGSDDVVASNADVFLSRQDYANAIADPKYQTSPQYRAEIDAKLARTMKTGGYKA